MSKNLFAIFFAASFCFVMNPLARAQVKADSSAKMVTNANASTTDSLKMMLISLQSKKPDSALQKIVAEAQIHLEAGIINDTLATKLLEVEDALFNKQFVNKKTLLQYALSVMYLIRHATLVNPKTIAVGLNSLANVYTTMGLYQNVLPLYEEALSIIKNSIGTDNSDYAGILVSMGLFYADMGLYDKALPLFQHAEEICKKTGQEDFLYAAALNSEALTRVTMGTYEKALPLYEKALEILRKIGGEETPDYGSILNNQANLYENLGLYQEALPLFERIIAIDKKNFPQENPDCALSICNFGYLYESMGQYGTALPLYQHALSIIEKDLGKENSMYAKILGNLASLYQSLGEYTKAGNLERNALAIRKKVLPKDHPDYAMSLNNVAGLYKTTGEYQKALPLFQESLQINKKKFGIWHTAYATGLNSLGSLYSSMGLTSKAFKLFDSALQIRRKVLGENHPDFANSLTDLAGLYKRTGRYVDALDLYQQALEIRKKAFGEMNPDYANSLNNLGLTYRAINDNKKAVELLSQSFRIRVQNIADNFTTLSEDEKLKFLLTETPNVHYLPSVLFSSNLNDPHTLNQLYTGELILKGMVLQDQQSVLSAIRKSRNNTILQQYQQWRFFKKMIGQQQLLPAIKRRNDLDSLQNVATELEQVLSRNSATFRNQQLNQSVKANAVGQKLSKGEAAIEFIRFTMHGKKSKDSTMYAALIVFPQDTSVRFVPLFEEKQLLNLLRTRSGQNTGIFTLYPPDDEKNTSTSSALYKLIWQPLEKRLNGVHTVYYAPAGLLHRIAFNALRKNDKHLLIDDYRLNQLLSTRTVVTSNPSMNKPAAAMLWGDIEYNAKSQITSTANGSVARRSAAATFNLYTNDTRGYRMRSPWLPLRQTKKEISDIQKALTNAGVSAGTASGAGATEEVFKALDRKSPQVLHLATHGFFLPVAEIKPTKNSEIKNDNNIFMVQQNPMFRSGLVLAGGNTVWLGKTALIDKEDGILTAYEISQMDLSNTELVVLSACETALGDIQGNEGVIGLQRAFKMAGVNQIVMSLWQVPDIETTELMTLFYKNWLDGKSAREALRQAQLAMRKKYPPFDWAGFVLVE